MLIDYVYSLADGFVTWLEENRPGVPAAIRASGRQPLGYRVSARVDLDSRFQAKRHMLLFVDLPDLDDLESSARRSFDRALYSDKPMLLLDAHPDDKVVEKLPAGLALAGSVQSGEEVFLPINEAKRAGMRFVQVRVVSNEAFVLCLAAPFCSPLLFADVDVKIYTRR